MITKNFMRYLNIMGSLVENRYYDFKTTIIDILGEKNVIAMPRVYCGDDSITNFLMSGLHDTSLRDVSSGSSSDCAGTGLFLGSGGRYFTDCR